MAEIAAQPRVHIRHQRFRMRAWIRTRLWAQVLTGMMLGFAIGIVLGPDTGWLTPETSEAVGRWLALPGQIFLGLIAMVLVPLIFNLYRRRTDQCRLGRGSARRGPASGRLHSGDDGGGGLDRGGAGPVDQNRGPAWWAHSRVPVARMSRTCPSRQPPRSTAHAPPTSLRESCPAIPQPRLPRGTCSPWSCSQSWSGLAILQVDREKTAPFLRLLDALLSIAMEIVKWAMFLAPFRRFRA